MHAELMVSLELFFIEELIKGSLVREVRMIGAISLDEFGLVAGHG